MVPNFRDLTIKTRETHGLTPPMLTTSYFKGPRERIEHRSEVAPRDFGPGSVSIMQCDQRTIIHLSPRTRTYFSLNGGADHIRIEHHISKQRPTGPEVTVTINSVDTGERCQEASYEARHIKTTITVDPSKGAVTKAGKTEIDGWYLDLPGVNCRGDAPGALALSGFAPGLLIAHPDPRHDHIVFKQVGTAPRGLAIEEKSTQRTAGNVFVNRTELVDISEEVLDESLFEIPADYSPASPEHTISPVDSENTH